MPDRVETLLAQRAWLRALARQLVARTDVADEVAHDALATAVTQPLPQRAGPRAWLAAILRRQLAGRQRAEFRRRDREGQAARPEAQPSAGDTVARFEVQRDVASAVLALPEPYRTTVLLRFWDGLSPGAIAPRQGVPVETVRTRLKRGLQQLRERLDRAHSGDRAAWALPLLGVVPRMSVTSSLLTGVLLMHTTYKLLAVAVAAAALLLVVVAPWSWAGSAPPASDVSTPAVATAEAPSPAAPVVPPPAGDVDRVAVPDPAAPAWLEVTGLVVADDTGAPLQGCGVELAGLPVAQEGGVADVTAADGRFTLRDARRQRSNGRRLIARAMDRAPAIVGVPYESREQELQRVDLGTIRVVAGTLFSGRVLTIDGVPVTGAELWLPASSSGYRTGSIGPQNVLGRATPIGGTDAAGRFTLTERIAPDREHHNLLFATSSQGIGWTTFVTSKQRREVDDLDLRLRPAGALRVLVLGATGDPVAGATVRALPRFGPVGVPAHVEEEVSGEPELRALFTGQTDAQGTVFLAHLPIGEQQPRIGGHDFDEHSYDLWVTVEGLGRQPLVACRVQPGTTQDVIVRLVATNDVTVDVDVRDDLGIAVPGAQVRVSGEHSAEARTDAAGHAQIRVPAVAKLWIRASSDGHREAAENVTLTDGARSAQVTLTLARTRPLDGRVVDQTGAPAPRFSIFVEQQHLAVTDADGRFHVDDFPVGPRRIVAATPAGEDHTHWIGEQEPETVDAAAGPVTIVLQRRLGRVDVRAAVVDAESGEPLELANAEVRLFEPRAGLYAWPAHTTHDHGVVTGKSLPAGRWRLDVRAVSGQRGSREFELTVGQPPYDLRLELPRPGTLTGRLRFVDVQPPATVTLGVAFVEVDSTKFVQYHFPGRWRPEPEQTVVHSVNGSVGLLQLQPALGTTFRLDSVDPTADLRLTVFGDGIVGEAVVRVPPGDTRDVVLEVRVKGR